MKEISGLLLCLTFLVHYSSCTKDVDIGKGKLQYFDLSGFIAEESKTLSAKNPQVQKMVFLNGKTEQKHDTIGNWENELSAFKEADINKRSFLGKYQVDSTFNGDRRLVTYAAMEEKFRTRELAIQYDSGNKPVKISAAIATSNVLYSSHQEMVYEPGKGFSISGKQVIRFIEPDSFYVEARF